MSQNKKFILLCIAEFTGSIAAAIVGSARKLCDSAPTGDSADIPATGSPAAEPPTEEKPKRRGRPPGATEPGAVTPPAAEPVKEAVAVDPLDELKKAAQPIIEEAGQGAKVKKWLDEHGVKRISDIPAEHHAAFLAEMKKLKQESEANLM